MPISFPLVLENGYPVADVAGTRVLIDTGSPASIGKPGNAFEFDGTAHTLVTSHIGQTVERISTSVQVSFDVLIGNDLLQRKAFAIDYRGGQFVWDLASLPEQGVALNLKDKMGIPSLSAQVNGRNAQLIVDTGATKAYLNESFTRGLDEVGSIEDFSPVFGAIQSPAYSAELTGLGEPFACEFGNLPFGVQQMLNSLGVDGIVGQDVFQRFVASFSLGMHTLHLSPQ